MRLLYCLQILSIVFFSAMHEKSVVHDIARIVSPDVWFVLVAMCTVSVIGILDTIVNDILPDSCNFRFGLHKRHAIYMALGLGYAVVLWFALQAKMYAAIPYFLINIIFIVISAFVDVQYRFKEGGRKRRKNDKNKMGEVHA